MPVKIWAMLVKAETLFCLALERFRQTLFSDFTN